jgi:P pilus assembly chaperone PapD
VSGTAIAQGGLILTPKRIVLEGRKNVAELNLLNVSDMPLTYVASFVEYGVSPDGRYIEIDTLRAEDRSASPYLRLFPRRFTLQPKESQTLRVQFRSRPDLAPGEYRSHLSFRQVDVAQEAAARSPNGAAEENGELGVSVSMLFNITIPVIVRHGETSGSAAIDSLQLLPGEEESPPRLSFRINRSGNQSLHGDLLVELLRPDQKTLSVVKRKGVTVFTPNLFRSFSLPLDLPEGAELLSGSQLRIRFMENTEKRKPAIFAEALYDIPR